jgi:hypothetical protein
MPKCSNNEYVAPDEEDEIFNYCIFFWIYVFINVVNGDL